MVTQQKKQQQHRLQSSIIPNRLGGDDRIKYFQYGKKSI